MARSGFVAFVLFLGLVISNVYGDNTTILCQKILEATLNTARLSDFSLTVTPDKLLSNAHYNVELDGAGNFTVLLRALAKSNPIGNWTGGNDSCDGSPLFVDYFQSKKRIETIWTSPDNVTSVTINAYIHNGTDTFHLHQTLSQESNSTTNTTTAAPTTGHKESSKTAVTVASSTHHVEKTTSTGSIEQSSLLLMALSVVLSLLLIPAKNFS